MVIHNGNQTPNSFKGNIGPLCVQTLQGIIDGCEQPPRTLHEEWDRYIAAGSHRHCQDKKNQAENQGLQRIRTFQQHQGEIDILPWKMRSVWTESQNCVVKTQVRPWWEEPGWKQKRKWDLDHNMSQSQTLVFNRMDTSMSPQPVNQIWKPHNQLLPL